MTLAYFNNSVFLTVSYESRLACDDRGHAVNTETQKSNDSACQVGSSGLPSCDVMYCVVKGKGVPICDMKAYGGEEVKLQSSLNSALGGGEWKT